MSHINIQVVDKNMKSGSQNVVCPRSSLITDLSAEGEKPAECQVSILRRTTAGTN